MGSKKFFLGVYSCKLKLSFCKIFVSDFLIFFVLFWGVIASLFGFYRAMFLVEMGSQGFLGFTHLNSFFVF